MHYLDESQNNASAPVLLFVHGNPTWSFHWRNLISALSSQYRCVAIDHLGCGFSEPCEPGTRLADRIGHLEEFVEQLDLNGITLVAQDWGGAIGLGTILSMPARFERIVLFNTGAFPPWYVPWRIRLCRTPLVGQWAVQGANLFSRAALRMTLARQRHLPRDVQDGYLAPYDNWSNRRAVYDFVADIPMSPAHPTWQTLQEIDAGLAGLADRPAQLLWGLRDWCFTPACLDRFRASWPAARVASWEDVGHWVLEDAPQESLQAISQFLADTDTPRPSDRASAAESRV